MKKGIIADIQRASVHDGPGLRTTVFFKGCPLNCKWCHNPECINFKPQILFYPEKCIHCGMCKYGCYSGAKVVCGKEMDIDQVMKEIMLDKDYYDNGGGVTFSGGEPMAQKDFLLDLIIECKKHNIKCGIETSLIYYDEKIFKNLDIIMADFKIWNNDIHKEYTGVSNKNIKEHFIMINNLNIPIVARTPVITEINQEIEKISQFLFELKNVKRYELLPYHPLGESKRIALGEKENKFMIPSKEIMKELNKYAFIR